MENFRKVQILFQFVQEWSYWDGHFWWVVLNIPRFEYASQPRDFFWSLKLTPYEKAISTCLLLSSYDQHQSTLRTNQSWKIIGF